LNYTNQVWEATWGAFPPNGSGGTKFPSRFVLAKRDPSCNPTTGLVRVNGSSLSGYSTDGVDHGTSGAAGTAVKGLCLVRNTAEYNIWTVNAFDGADGTSGSFVAGFAYFPGASPTLDGTMILASQFRRPLGDNITLAHEFGHAFGL